MTNFQPNQEELEEILEEDPKYKVLKEELDQAEREIKALNEPIEGLETNIKQIQAQIYRAEKQLTYDLDILDKHRIEREIEASKVQIEKDQKELEAQRSSEKVKEREKRREVLLLKRNSLASRMKEREAKAREEYQKIIQYHQIQLENKALNLHRYISRLPGKTKSERKFGHHIANLYDKKVSQMFDQICQIFNARIVRTNQMSKHYARKYKNYCFNKFRRGRYLIPVDFPLRKKSGRSS